MTTEAEQSTHAAPAEAAVSEAALQQQLRTLRTQLQANRQAYHLALENGDLAAMRTSRIEFDELAGRITDLEALLKIEEEIAFDLRRVALSHAQRKHRQDAARDMRHDFERANKALAGALAAMRAGCVLYRDFVLARQSAHLRLRAIHPFDRRVYDDYDNTLQGFTSAGSLFSRMSSPSAGIDTFGSEVCAVSPERYAELADASQSRVLQEYTANHRRALEFAEGKLLPPTEPEPPGEAA